MTENALIPVRASESKNGVFVRGKDMDAIPRQSLKGWVKIQGLEDIQDLVDLSEFDARERVGHIEWDPDRREVAEIHVDA